MILLLDIGNTRLKSACLTAAGLQSQAPLSHDGRIPSELLQVLRDQSRPEAIWLCSVGADSLARDIESFVSDEWQLPTFQLCSRRQQAGVLNAYRDPETLGADRWAALLAAMSGGLAPCCIIDCGTAMTLDALDATGQHLGGQIVPGMRLMREALGQGTIGVGRQPDAVHSLHFGRSTAEAVGGGVLQTSQAAIRRFHQQAAGQFSGKQPRLLLTGGDAPVLLDPLVDLAPVHCPDLVLQGLAVAARDAG